MIVNWGEGQACQLGGPAPMAPLGAGPEAISLKIIKKILDPSLNPRMREYWYSVLLSSMCFNHIKIRNNATFAIILHSAHLASSSSRVLLGLSVGDHLTPASPVICLLN